MLYRDTLFEAWLGTRSRGFGRGPGCVLSGASGGAFSCDGECGPRGEGEVTGGASTSAISIHLRALMRPAIASREVSWRRLVSSRAKATSLS